MPSHGFSSRLQQRYASTTAQAQQNVRPGVYHRGLNKLTTLGGPVVPAAGVGGFGNRASSVPAAPRPVQTSSLRKENGGQDVTAVLVNRGGGKKVGWGSSLPATPAPAPDPATASLGPTPADVAAKEAAEKEKASQQPPSRAQEEQEREQQQLPPPRHPPLPPPPVPGSKNIPWALHPPSQPPASLGGPPPGSHSAPGDYPRPGGDRPGGGPGGPRDDYRDRGNDVRGGYSPNDRYGGGSYVGGGRYDDRRRYSDGPYDSYDDRRGYRDREWDHRGGDYHRDWDWGYHRSDYRGDGAYPRGGYGRDRDYDYRGGGGGGPYRDRYHRGDDRRWSDYERNRHDDHRDGLGRRRFNDSDPFRDGRRDFDRPPPTEPTRIQGRGDPLPLRNSNTGTSEPTTAPEQPPPQQAPPQQSPPEQQQQQQKQPRDSHNGVAQPSELSGLHLVPARGEVDAALEAVRAREEAEERARRRKEEPEKLPPPPVAAVSDVQGERQQPSEDATVRPLPADRAPVAVQKPNAILSSSENQSSGEASGDASLAEANAPVWTRETKRFENATSPIRAPVGTSSARTVEPHQQLEKIGEVRHSAPLSVNAGQVPGDVQPKKDDSARLNGTMLRQREEKSNSDITLKAESSGSDVDGEQNKRNDAAPVGNDAPQPTDEQQTTETKARDDDSTKNDNLSERGEESEKVVEVEECETEEERRRKQQQIILQQVAAVRNKKEKQRRKEKRSAASSAPQIVSRAKDPSESRENKPEASDQPADAMPGKPKRQRNRRPRTRGVLYKKLPDGTFVDADLCEEDLAKIEKMKAELEKQRQKMQQKQQQKQQQQVQHNVQNQFQLQRQDRAGQGAKKDATVKAVEPPKKVVDNKKVLTPSKSPKEFVPAPPPAVSAWKQGPPPGIVKSSPKSSPLPAPRNLGASSEKKLSPGTLSFHHDDSWKCSSDFPKLGRKNNADDSEAASWIPPPIDAAEKQKEKPVIAAPLIMGNVGSWNAFSNGAPISASAADWSVRQPRVDAADWSRAAPAPVLDTHTDEDDTAHLTDGSGAVPRDLLSSGPGSEDDGDSAREENKESSAAANGKPKRKRSGRPRRGGRGRTSQKEKAAGDQQQHGKTSEKNEAPKSKKSSRRGKKRHEKQGESFKAAGPSHPSNLSGRDASKQVPHKPAGQGKPFQSGSQNDQTSADGNKAAETGGKKRSRRPRRNNEPAMRQEQKV